MILKEVALRKNTTLRVWAFFLLLVVLVPLGGAGCGSVPGFGANITVPDRPEQALAEGAKKVAAADAKAEKEPTEAARLYGEAVAYYGAVARKFPGGETGFRAMLTEASLQRDKIKNLPLAQTTLRNTLKQYPPTTFPALHQQAQAEYDALVARMDAENRETPYYQAMAALVNLLGGDPRYSNVLAIFVISVGVTLALWPLRAKQYRSMKEMQRHAPELKKIQEKYKDDRALQQEKVMAFYKEHGFNPMAGCLPMLAQMPVLWLLYHAISLYQFQFAKSTFLWINPATAAASASWPAPLTGSVARSLGEQDLILLFVYAVSMYFQTKLTPASDPTQAEQQKIMAVVMPVMFFVMMLQWHLPSAFVLYWFLSNVLMVAQQWYINRGIHLPPLPAESGADGEGAPKNGSGSNGTAAAESALAPSAKLISPKSRKNRKR